MTAAAIDAAVSRHYDSLAMQRQAVYDAAEGLDGRIDAMVEAMLLDPAHEAWSDVDGEALDKVLRPACAHFLRRRRA